MLISILAALFASTYPLSRPERLEANIFDWFPVLVEDCARAVDGNHALLAVADDRHASKKVMVGNFGIDRHFDLLLPEKGGLVIVKDDRVAEELVPRANYGAGFKRDMAFKLTEVSNRFIDPDNLVVSETAHVGRWGAPTIFPDGLQEKSVRYDRPVLIFAAHGPPHAAAREKPRAVGMQGLPRIIGRFTSGLGALLSFQQRPNQKAGAEGAEGRPNPRREYLVFGGISSPYLGIQIAGIVLLAFACCSVTGYSLFRRLQDDHGKWRWTVLAVVSGLCGLFFWGWGWGWAGNPLSAWGLAP